MLILFHSRAIGTVRYELRYSNPVTEFNIRHLLQKQLDRGGGGRAGGARRRAQLRAGGPPRRRRRAAAAAGQCPRCRAAILFPRWRVT